MPEGTGRDAIRAEIRQTLRVAGAYVLDVPVEDCPDLLLVSFRRQLFLLAVLPRSGERSPALTALMTRWPVHLIWSAHDALVVLAGL